MVLMVSSILLKKITDNNSESTGKRIKPNLSISGEDALCFVVGFQHRYHVLRLSTPEKWPVYKTVEVAKEACYP